MELQIECYGKEFDPNYHEALFQTPTSDHAENTVVQVVTQGYMLHEQVLRPAKVGIAIKPNDTSDGDDENK